MKRMGGGPSSLGVFSEEDGGRTLFIRGYLVKRMGGGPSSLGIFSEEDGGRTLFIRGI